jgi:hypothetical protein
MECKEGPAAPMTPPRNTAEKEVRNDPEQPPVIPHTTEGYQIDINGNKRLSYHAGARTERFANDCGIADVRRCTKLRHSHQRTLTGHGKWHGRVRHAVPVEPGLRALSPENGNISNISRRLSAISF